MRRRLIAALVPLLALSTSCTVGPDYTPPTSTTPSTFPGVPATSGEAPLSRSTAAEMDLSQWWTQFHDPILDQLIGEALKSNLDLQAAASRIRQAREQEIIAGAAGVPKLNANGMGANLHSNGNPLAALSGGSSGGSGGGTAGAPPSGPTNIKLYSAGFDSTWEIDVFGGVRRGVEAARANTDAAAWDMRDGEVSLTAEIANDYLALRATQVRIAILRDEARHQHDFLGLVGARRRAGFVTQLDVNQQQVQVTNTEAQLPPLEAQAQESEHALETLLAKKPEALAAQLATSRALPAVPTELPVGLPSDLLRRRPDIREAERKLAAATANVGVAVADLFPKFNLVGTASFTGGHLSNLLSSSNFGVLGFGQITWPIFDAGKIRANIGSSEEQRRQAYLAYREAVLRALQDATDALARYSAEQLRLLSLQRGVQAAQSSVRIATEQYRIGLVTFINVLTAETALLSDQDELAQSHQALAQDLVSLYKALGGGWSADETPTPPS